MISIVHGDSFEMVLPEADHVITDPPYTAHVQKNMRSSHSKHVGGKVRVDSCAPVLAGFDSMDDVSKMATIFAHANRWRIAFCALEQLGEYAKLPGWIRSGIYRKKRAMPQLTGDRPAGSCEGIAILHGNAKKKWNGKGTHAFWQAMPEHRRVTKHPTAKPVELCLQIVHLFTNPGDHILDPFCGTGSMAIACALLGRSYFGVDKNLEYIKIANSRLANIDEKYVKMSKMIGK